MKKIIYHLLLLAGLASVWIARAQTNAVPPGQPIDNTNATAAAAPVTNTAPDAGATPAANAAPPVTNAAAAAVDPNSGAGAATADLGAASGTNAPAPAVESIPLIQFSDVPITTAIEHLARQAGINYMLDPKIGYGQPDQNGQVKVEPQLSIRWENITAQSALVALLDNYGLQLVMDKRTGIDRVTAKDPLAPPPLITRVLQLQYASVSNMTEAVQSVLADKRSRVMADVRTSQMLVVATDPEQQSVDTLVAELDKPTRQVLIETKLIEISSQPSAKRGVDWTSTLSAQNVTFGNGNISGNNTITTPGPTTTKTVTTPGGGHTSTTSTTAPSSASGLLSQVIGGGGWSASTMGSLVPSTAFLNADGLEAVISFLNASYDAQIYSTPRVVTLDNQTAHIEVIRTYPVISISGGSANSAASATINYSNVGTVLDVTPRISANDKIWLNVIPEVSDHFADVQVTVGNGQYGSSSTYPVPIFDRRRIQSQVMIPNGNTLVMGGLVQDSPNATYSKVPFLGDIPGLGWAFHSESKSMSKDNLIIFLTPTIVKDSDFQPSASASTFLQSKPRTMRSPMNPNKIWDGAEPEKSWDNPAPVPNEFGDVQPAK
ncbi:MAG: secretin N-terminal domain-containing protein [Verrucomicrobiota bacterium]|jgi:type II secretory pathway component GspD/PulD (secretin)